MVLPKSKLWRLLALAGALALALGAYYRFGRAPAVDPAQLLPAYAAASSTLALHGSDPFEIVARPSSPPPKVVAYAFAIGDREPDPIDATTELLPDGTIRIRGAARALQGAREARLVIGTPASFRRFDDALARAKSNESDASIRVLSFAIVR